MLRTILYESLPFSTAKVKVKKERKKKLRSGMHVGLCKYKHAIVRESV